MLKSSRSICISKIQNKEQSLFWIAVKAEKKQDSTRRAPDDYIPREHFLTSSESATGTAASGDPCLGCKLLGLKLSVTLSFCSAQHSWETKLPITEEDLSYSLLLSNFSGPNFYFPILCIISLLSRDGMSLLSCHEILNIRGISRSHIIKHNKKAHGLWY